MIVVYSSNAKKSKKHQTHVPIIPMLVTELYMNFTIGLQATYLRDFTSIYTRNPSKMYQKTRNH